MGKTGGFWMGRQKRHPYRDRTFSNLSFNIFLNQPLQAFSESLLNESLTEIIRRKVTANLLQL